MISDPTIRIVVGSNFLRSVTAANQGTALLGLLSRLLALVLCRAISLGASSSLVPDFCVGCARLGIQPRFRWEGA